MSKSLRLFFQTVISLFLFSLLFAACSMFSGEDNSGPDTSGITATITLDPDLNPNISGNTVTAIRNADTFTNANDFNDFLAIASFCLAVSAETEQKLKYFYEDFEFDNVKTHNATSVNYDDNKNIDSISYGLAHCKDQDFDVIAVAIRGGNYGAEWGSNFDLGATGDHAGFSSAAKKVYEGLKTYIDTNYSTAYDNKYLKIWITGYSRAAAVSNVLSYYILTGLESDSTYEKLNIDADDVFVYTFATPRALCSEHAKPYPNVFNLFSKADIVTYVAPEQYGLYRCGIEKILFESNEDQYKQIKEIDYKGSTYTRYKVYYISLIDTYLKEFNDEIEVPGFCFHKEYDDTSSAEFPENCYKTEKQCIEFFFKQIFEPEESKTGGFDLTSREKFAETAQPTIQYIVKLYMTNSDKFPEVIESISSDFSQILGWISSKDAFCNAVKETLDSARIDYDSAENLKRHCGILYDAVDPINQDGSLSAVVMGKILPLLLSGNHDFQRILKMHYPEVTCISLLKYLE